MSLSKQNIEVNLSLGLDTKTDKKHVMPGKLTVARNAVYRKDKQLEKRPGNDALSNLDIDGNELGIGSGLAVFNDELLQYNSQSVYSYSSSLDRWVNKGDAISAIVTTNQIINNTAAQTQVDSAIVNNIGVYAWEDSRGGVRASIIDESSNVPLLADVVLDASGTRPRCLAFRGFIFTFYVNGGNLYVRRLDPRNPTAFDTAYLVSSTINSATPIYDVYAYQDLRIMYVHAVNGASQAKVGWLDETPYNILAFTFLSVNSTKAIGIVLGPSNQFYVLCSGAGFYCAILGNTGAVIYAPFFVDGGALTDIESVTGYALDDNTGINIYYGRTSGLIIYTANILVNGTAPTFNVVFTFNCSLYSKVFNFVDHNGVSNFYFAVYHNSSTQGTYFITRTDGLIVAKQLSATAGGNSRKAFLANVNNANDIYTYGILKKNKIISENGTLYSPTGVSKTSIDFSNEDLFTTAQLGNNLLIVGGILNMYDGQSVVEHGFLLYPEIATNQDVAGVLADGTYGVIVVYEWTDAFGQLHRSSPSVAEVVVISGGSGIASIEVIYTNLFFTAKKGDRTAVSIAVYCTEKNGTIFYRASSLSSPIYNDPTAFQHTYNITDVSSITSNEILYTTGGILPNIAAPSCSVIEVFQDRVWLGGLEEKDLVWYSKNNPANSPVQFSDQFTLPIESFRGKVNAFSVLGDKFLFIKKDKVYFTYGDGPNDTNTLGSFAQITNTNIDIGTTSAKSVVSLPTGLMLKTNKGYYSIDGNFNTAYLGAPVEDYNDLITTAGVQLSDYSEVRYTTSNGDLLVYNYFYDRWSTFYSMQANDSILYGSTYTVLRTDGQIFQENQEIYKDNLAAYTMELVTGWFAFAGVTGYKRVYRLTFLGEYKSKHQLRISVGYNYNNTWMHSAIFNPDTALPVSLYGQDSPYGEAGTVYGGPENTYLVDVRTVIQKCTSIRFKIEELVTSATTGTQQSLTISDIALLVGVKPGAARLKAAQQVALS